MRIRSTDLMRRTYFNPAFSGCATLLVVASRRNREARTYENLQDPRDLLLSQASDQMWPETCRFPKCDPLAACSSKISRTRKPRCTLGIIKFANYENRTALGYYHASNGGENGTCQSLRYTNAWEGSTPSPP